MSCLVWLPWWLWHGAMDRFEGTLFRVNVDWLDFWLDNFNSVIRLSRVQPLAAVFSAFGWDPAASAVLVNPWNLHLFMNGITRNYQNSRFSSLLKLLQYNTAYGRLRQVHAFQVWWSFSLDGFSGAAQHFVHLIRLNLNSCLLPMWLDRPRSRLRE